MQGSTQKNQGVLLNSQQKISIASLFSFGQLTSGEYKYRNSSKKYRNTSNEANKESFQSIDEQISAKSTHESDKIKLPKSLNHNFQKHTVVTIKKLCKTLTFSFGSTNIDLIAHQMWNIFLSSGIKSKRILVILFGIANFQDQKYKELLKSCFFGELCNFGEQTVRSAQNLLRNKVLSMLSEDRIRKVISEKRYIKMREAFFHYFMNFVETLKQGPLIKFRINAQTSQRIIQRMNASVNSLRPEVKARSRRSNANYHIN